MKLHACGIAYTRASWERINERVWDAERGDLECLPPSEDAVETAKESLHGFFRLRAEGGRLQASTLSAEELDDLAYFVSVIGAARPATARAASMPACCRIACTAGADRRPGDEDASILAGLRTGGLETALRQGAAGLLGNGEPPAGESAAVQSSAPPWGPYPQVAADLALVAETLGRLDLAMQFFRGADPCLAAASESCSADWASNVRGTIRAAERSGDCATALMARLARVHELQGSVRVSSSPPEDYGIDPIRAWGLDPERLYRGALVTLYRDGGRESFGQAVQALAPDERQTALERYDRNGDEGWEAEVLGLEGQGNRIKHCVMS